MKDDLLEHQVDIAGRRIILRSPGRADDLLEELAQRAPSDPDVLDERLPYWADLWPSALALATHLLEERSIRPDETVIELGCGLGLAGIAAGLTGADVLLTDYSEEALRYAEQNWRHNVETEPRTRSLDWREPPDGLRADVLLAADVAYEKRFFDPLIETFRTLLKAGGRVLLSEPGRGLAGEFFHRLEASCCVWTRRDMNVEVGGRKHEIGLYEIVQGTGTRA